MPSIAKRLPVLLLALVLSMLAPTAAHADSDGLVSLFANALSAQSVSGPPISSDWVMLREDQGFHVVDESYTAYYTGLPVTPVTHVAKPDTQSGGYSTVLTLNEFTVAYSNNTAPSATGSLAKATAIRRTDEGVSYFVRYFTIKKHSLADPSEVVVSPVVDQQWTGSEIRPPVTVTSRITGEVFVEGRDYSLLYSGNVDEGTARVVVQAIDGDQSLLSGSKLLTFQIQAQLGNTSVWAHVGDWDLASATSPRTYSGLPICPKPTVSYGGAVLVEGEDYILEYRDNVNAGTASIDVVPLDSSSAQPQERRDLLRTENFEIRPVAISLASVAPIDTQFFSGSPVCPELSVSYNGRLLALNAEYAVSYSDNTAPGTATVTVSPLTANFYGTKEMTFTIVDNASQLLSIASAEVTVSNAVYAQGRAVKPKPVVEFDGTVLVEGADYELSYLYDVPGYAVGRALVKVVGRGRFCGQAFAIFNITPMNLAAATMSWPDNISDENCPPTVTLNGTVLVHGTDFTFSRAYKSDGSDWVTVSGKGNYSGSVSRKVADGPINLPSHNAKVSVASATYTGDQLKPKVTVTAIGKTLVEGTDYTCAYSNNVNAGTGKVSITGKGMFGGKLDKTFTINKASLGRATMEPIPKVTYTGSAQTPVPSISFGGRKLVIDKDFTCKYASNVNAGGASVMVTGIGNFKDGISCAFVIDKKSVSGAEVFGGGSSGSSGKPDKPSAGPILVDTSSSEPVGISVEAVSAKTYTGSAIKPRPIVEDNERYTDLELGKDYALEYKNNVNVGTATVTVKGIGNYSGSKTLSFTIKKKSVSKLSAVSISKQKYTGKAIKPKPTVKNGNRKLKLNTDYKLTYSNNKNVGEGTVTVTGKGNYKGTKKLTFSIAKPKDVSKLSISSIGNKKYTGKVIKPKPTVKDGKRKLKLGKNYKLTYKNNKKVGTATVTVTGIGWYTGSKSMTFQIVKKK